MKRILITMAVVLVVASSVFAQTSDADFESKVRNLEKELTPAFVFIGGGSGVLISPDGYMLTNDHVAGEQQQWNVNITGGKMYRADMIGKDPRGDICLLKLQDAENLPYVKIGNSDDLKSGEYVVAIGNPFMLGREDFRPTVTVGVVSAIHRLQNNYTDAIQTDASINPGNSGGPLFNMRGELVGINGQIMYRYGNKVNSGVGFAIPTTQIERFMPKLKAAKGGVVPHGYIEGLNMDQEWADGKGGLIDTVDAGSTAEEAGFEPGDLIVKVGPYDVHNQFRVFGYMGTWPAGTDLDFVVVRDGEQVTVTAMLDEIPERGRGMGRRRQPPRRQPAPEPQPEPEPQPTPDADGPSVQLGIRADVAEVGPGIEILLVEDDSPAKEAGLKEGDIIKKIDGWTAGSMKLLADTMKKKKPGDSLKLRVQRGEDEMNIVVDFPK